MEGVIFLLIKILFFTSLIPVCFLFLKIIGFGAQEFKKNIIYNFFILISSIILFSIFIYMNPHKKKVIVENNNIIEENEITKIVKKPNLNLLNPNYKFTEEIINTIKISTEEIDFEKCLEKKVRKNENITSILKPFNFSNKEIYELDNYLKANKLFDFKKIKPGDKYSLIFFKKNNQKPTYLGYELNKGSFLILNLENLTECKVQSRPFEIKKHELSGIISTHLWQAVNEQVESNLETEAVVSVLADKIYPWTIRFTHLNPNDKFKIIYEAKYINNEFIKIENVYASVFMHKNENYYAIPFKENLNQKYNDYFDESGNNLRNFFLQAPVDFRRISSKYSKSRRHPVTGRVTAHKGTDFAAESGSPIFSTADGVITAAKYKKYNGYYVKIRHNNTYETQYLHMQKKSVNYWKKKGIRVGKKIKQGEIIGFVGQTGLATGPHVCYRFWKNGKQVDPFKQNLPPSQPIKEKNRDNFNLKKEKWIKKLNEISYPDELFIDLNS